MKFQPPKKFAYQLSTTSAILYFVGIIGLYGLFHTRHSQTFWDSFPFDYMHSWGNHVSNLSIMFLILAAVGMTTVMLDRSAKSFWCILLAFVGINIIYELWIPVLNTPDKVDILFGLVGAALGGLLFVFALKTRKPAGKDKKV